MAPLLIVTLAAAGAVLVWRTCFWVVEGRKMKTSGHLPPSPSRPARLFAGALSRLLTLVFVGRVEVRGGDAIPRRGRVVVVCNHVFYLDFFVLKTATRLDVRFLTKVAQLPGLRGVLGAWTGAIPVDTEVNGGGARAIDAAVGALRQSPNGGVLVFPQGRLIRDNVLRREDFRTGGVRIGRRAQAELGEETVVVLPVVIHYRRHPRSRLWPHRLFRSLGRGFAHAHAGAIVSVGRPIPVDRLPADPAEATEVIRETMQALLATAQREDVRRRPSLRSYLRSCGTCGYLPDPPSPTGLRRARTVTRALVSIQVGGVTIEGREHLDVPAPRIIAANHGHWIDPFVVGLILDGPARYMAARGLLRFCGGLGALMVAPWGAFCVDLRAGRGGGAIGAARRALTSEQTVVMFPEGWAYLDGEMGDFKPGIVHIARESARRIGRPVPIVPVFLRYGRYPGPWIRRLPPPLQYLFVFVCFARYRRGATIVVGPPIDSDSLPADRQLATETVRRAIVSLDSARARPVPVAPEPIPI